MNRIQKLKYNTIFSLLAKISILISGMILPRLILNNYGSEVNGLVNSITQFLSVITFLDLGVGAVVQSTLYKPLAENNAQQISNVLFSAKKYFRNIAYILLLYILFLIITYPLLINNPKINYLTTGFLILAISLNQFGQYYFGIVNEILLNADQKAYVQLITEIIVVILNLLTSSILITNGFAIYTVKFASGLIFLLRPLFLSYYVRKNYSIPFEQTDRAYDIPQKWNGMSQHIAYSIQNSADIVILTMYSTLSNVSVYSIYNMIVSAIRLIIEAFTTGIQAFFGNLYAEDQLDKLNKYFGEIEWGLHNLIVFLYSITASLITPFVLIYTEGINDVEYNAPIFAICLVIGRAFFSLRTPYQALIFAAGHFKKTQLSSFVEATINIVLSLLLVNKLGLIGVAIGSLIAILYRIIYMVNYLSKNIIRRSKKYFIKQILTDIISVLAICLVGRLLTNSISIDSFAIWVIIAIMMAIYSLIVIFIVNLFFYKKTLVQFIKKISNID